MQCHRDLERVPLPSHRERLLSHPRDHHEQREKLHLHCHALTLQLQARAQRVHRRPAQSYLPSRVAPEWREEEAKRKKELPDPQGVEAGNQERAGSAVVGRAPL